MRLKFFPGLVSMAIAALLAGCGGQVAVQNTSEGTGGGGAGGACSNCTGGGGATGGAGGGTQGPCDLSPIISGWLPKMSDQRITESVAIAATSTSYVIAYIERDPANATNRDDSLAILTDSGKFSTSSHDPQPGCAGAPVSRGAAVTYDANESRGLAAFAVSNCSGSGAGAMFLHLGANGSQDSTKQANNSGFAKLSLDPHALAPLGADQYAFAYTLDLTTSPGVTNAQLATLTGDAFNGAVKMLFGVKAADAVSVATSSSVRAVLGHLVSGAEVLQTATPGVDAGAGVQKQLGSQPWGAVTTIGGRVAVLLPTAAGLEYRLFQSNQQVQKHVLSNMPTSFGDITALGNRLIAVGAGAGAMSLYRIDQATSGTPSAVVKVPTNLQVPTLSQIAIAAGHGTVAVVYASKGTVGHWALFSCKN